MSRATIVVDLGFGDAGKGTIVDFLARETACDLVVRFSGGPQAGHNVCLPDGTHHTFAQFGAASFIPRVRTLLSRHMLIEPYALLNEARALAAKGVSDPMGNLLIDERCLVIAPPHIMANRIRERSRGASAHGTCGMGVGECVGDSAELNEDALRAGDFRDPATARRKLLRVLEHKRAELKPLLTHSLPEERRILEDASWIDAALDNAHAVFSRAQLASAERTTRVLRDAIDPLFEGAQGVLLDESFGFHPHTTWSNTTFSNAQDLLAEAGNTGAVTRLGVTRTYATRHGNGPLPTYCHGLTRTLQEPHNASHGWQGAFRCGALDLLLLRYALDVCGGADALAVTHLDALPELPKHVCVAYEENTTRFEQIPLKREEQKAGSTRLTTWLNGVQPCFEAWPRQRDAFISAIEETLRLKPRILSWGKTHREKAWRNGASVTSSGG